MPAAPIYLDHHATTPLDPRVAEAMAPYWRARFGNPHSRDHAVGWAAAEALETARAAIAALIGAAPADLVFTSGATEANNLAVLGSAAAWGEGAAHVVASAIEHASVRGPLRRLEARGVAVTWLPVDSDGLVDPAALAAAIRPDTRLVSVILANNEIGSLQPAAALAGICRARGVPLHLDAAQAAGKVPIDVTALGVDLLSVSAHKLYGPMGIGALFLRGEARVAPLFGGGRQEAGLRPGTVPLPLAVGFGAACRLAAEALPAEAQHLAGLRDRLLDGLRAAVPGLRVNGGLARRLPGNLNVSLPGAPAEAMMAAMPELAVSSGAACASATQEPSHVLRALGLAPEAIACSLRFGLGRRTTAAEIERAIAAVARAYAEVAGAAAGRSSPRSQ